MTVKTVYIPIILIPKILSHYFDAAFLFKTLKSTAAHSVIDVNNEVKLSIQKLASQPSNSMNKINLAPKNRIPFSPIMFLQNGRHNGAAILAKTTKWPPSG